MKKQPATGQIGEKFVPETTGLLTSDTKTITLDNAPTELVKASGTDTGTYQLRMPMYQIRLVITQQQVMVISGFYKGTLNWTMTGFMLTVSIVFYHSPFVEAKSIGLGESSAGVTFMGESSETLTDDEKQLTPTPSERLPDIKIQQVIGGVNPPVYLKKKVVAMLPKTNEFLNYALLNVGILFVF